MKVILIFLCFLGLCQSQVSLPCKKCRESRDYILDLFTKVKDNNINTVIYLCGFAMAEHICRYFIESIGELAIGNTIQWIRQTDAICGDLVCYNSSSTEVKVEDYRAFLSKHYPKGDTSPQFAADSEDFSMIVVNDIHLQMGYKEGTVVHCGQVAGCCEERWGEDKSGNGAGYWGSKDGTCDIPQRTFLKTLEFIKGSWIEVA